MSAHRFALTVALGHEILGGTIGEHYCCEPLCVRVADRHLRTSTQSENIGWSVFRGRHFGNRPGAGSDQRALRSQLVRAAVRHGWDSDRLVAARSLIAFDENQLRLW